MKNLILVRHGKSSWESLLDDIDRPLNQRGIQDANLVASNCICFLPTTYLIWSSIAKRASETSFHFAKKVCYPIQKIIIKSELYTFDLNQLEKVVKSCSNDEDNLILFGHNNAITDFVNKFGDILVNHIPPSGFVSLQFDTDEWGKIENGKINKIVFPKNLK